MEASDIPSKSEFLMFSQFTYCDLLSGQIVCIRTRPLRRYVTHVTQDITIFHQRQWKWQAHFALLQEMSLCHLLPFAKVGQSRIRNVPVVCFPNTLTSIQNPPRVTDRSDVKRSHIPLFFDMTFWGSWEPVRLTSSEPTSFSSTPDPILR